ncbi:MULTISPECIES: metal/formaldehyde-sensitive transcriptional repressor [unclassified Achromobacter]|jgi:FrmR/RcnR family transcriptional regulator, repressor of rcnA expression|uniref:metal/formaldehyde-sensitive transcriptional repressor n=1 Tax=unclassified Achromobacter TaxID=2626865 RepID=UPI000B51AE6D|nr:MULTISPECIES: metal/formaldehyde-sensitive transcriptional repressor [unclassified Achromobacter]OWT75360.1 transcriptional repressor rcnR [Achromobacter sp. HZ28]OWT76020.1 transcriptional repressor rcnR [Achromobacter sp. HZ34]
MHTIRDKAKLLARVRRIKGQVAALESQLDQEEDCGAILQQAAAVRGAVNGFMSTIIEGHLHDHVVHEPDVNQRQHDLDIVMQAIKSYLK